MKSTRVSHLSYSPLHLVYLNNNKLLTIYNRFACLKTTEKRSIVTKIKFLLNLEKKHIFFIFYTQSAIFIISFNKYIFIYKKIYINIIIIKSGPRKKGGRVSPPRKGLSALALADTCCVAVSSFTHIYKYPYKIL